MTLDEMKRWINEEQYPLTIITDRYGGTYSNGEILAFPLDFDEIPLAVSGDDVACAEFWNNYDEPVGRGTTINEAYLDLCVLIYSKIYHSSFN